MQENIDLTSLPNKIIIDGKCYELKEMKEEPNKTLWDKRIPFVIGAESGGFEFLDYDVKEALKKYFDWEDQNTIKSGRHHNEIIIRKEVRNRIFGKELI